MCRSSYCIPRILHYCWFGKKELPKLAKYCVRTWANHCEEYEIKRWDESNIDIESNVFLKTMYELGQYAFVSDYVRLFVLDKYGGVYLDTDVEMFKNIDVFLNNKFFTGHELYNYILSPFTAVLGCEKNNPLIKEFLSFYENENLDALNKKTNTRIISDILINKYPDKNINEDKTIEIEPFTIIYPSSYFCVYTEGISYTCHHFAGSWLTGWEKIKKKARKTIRHIFYR